MKINDKKIMYDWPPLQVPWIRWIWSRVLKPSLFRENVDHRIAHKFPAWKLRIEKKILCDWPPLQVPWIRWNWSHVLKSRLFRENVDIRIGHKFLAWKLTIEKKSFMIGHPYMSPLLDGIGPRSWNLACFEKTLTPELDINFQHEN